jgi:hypothetical protein
MRCSQFCYWGNGAGFTDGRRLCGRDFHETQEPIVRELTDVDPVAPDVASMGMPDAITQIYGA